jgi:hypothetical protein
MYFTPSWLLLDTFRLNAAASGVSVAAPLLDRRLHAYVLGTPADLWYRNGLTKFLPRQAFAGLLPDAVLDVPIKVMVTEPVHAALAANQALVASRFKAAARSRAAGSLAAEFRAAGRSAECAAQVDIRLIFLSMLACWVADRRDSPRVVVGS